MRGKGQGRPKKTDHAGLDAAHDLPKVRRAEGVYHKQRQHRADPAKPNPVHQTRLQGQRAQPSATAIKAADDLRGRGGAEEIG